MEIYKFVLDTVKDLFLDFNYYNGEILCNNVLRHYLVHNNLFLTFFKRSERLQIGKKDHVKYLNQFKGIHRFNIKDNILLFNNTVINISLYNKNMVVTIQEFEKINSDYIYNIYIMNRTKNNDLYKRLSLDKNKRTISVDINDYIFKNHIYFYITITSIDKSYMYNNIGYDFIPCIMDVNL